MKSRRFLAVAVLLASIGAIAAFAQQTKPPVMAHDAAGREQCLMCHTAGAMEAVPDVPADHADRAAESCLMCHAADSPIQTADPKPIPHDLQGRDNCSMCHTPGAMEAVPDTPASHEGWDAKYCTLCHTAAG